MADKKPSSIGQAINNFSFLLFGLLLTLAALAEGSTLKGGLLGLCALLSVAGAMRFRIAALVASARGRRRR
ncbi:MAG: hypothetical protein MUF74_07380 [Cypionkella sp.]|jgi:hypothetical protein|nr:hypothetical protein [Cypionkella sp.]